MNAQVPKEEKRLEMKHGDICASFICNGRLVQIEETGMDGICLELDEARALRDWLNKVLP